MLEHTASLTAFLRYLKAGDPLPIPEREGWSDMIRRTTAPGALCEVSYDHYDYFRDVLPPRWMGHGGYAFGEGADYLRLFWTVQERHFSRQLTADENRIFCRLVGIGLSSG